MPSMSNRILSTFHPISSSHEHEALGTLTGDKSNSVVFDNSKIKRFVPDSHCEVPWSAGVRRSLQWFEAALPKDD